MSLSADSASLGPGSEASSARLVGRYRLCDAIASGGMATVHIGRLLGPAGFTRTVAIKRLHPQFAGDPEFVSMFLDEARLAARIRHPNVIPTLEVVAAQGELFLVMEYVHGESLAALVADARGRGAPVPPAIAVSILSGCLHGLHAAHGACDERGQRLGIVHRDVSPQNLLVGADGMTRVLDFGVAKAIGRMHTTREGQVKGKLAYMAPEQLQAEGVTPNADVYAASVVLWETLTGRRLFAGDNETIVLARVLAGHIEPPSRISPDLARFDEVVMTGLARRPEERWGTAHEMALALERCETPASHAEVAKWLEDVAGSRLHDRAERVARIESASSGELQPSEQRDHGSDARRDGESDRAGAAAVPVQAHSLVSRVAVPPSRGRQIVRWGLLPLAAGVVIGAIVLLPNRDGSPARDGAAPTAPPATAAHDPTPPAPSASAASPAVVPEQASGAPLPSQRRAAPTPAPRKSSDPFHGLGGRR